MEALQRLHNRGSISTGYDVDYSCKFEHDNAESLSRGQAQGSQQTWTFSTWIKRTQLSENSNEPYQNIWSAGSSTSNATHVYFRGDSSYPDNQMFFYMDNGGSQFWHGRTPQSFRDTSAWYHLVWAVDTTQGTAANRSKIYINGEQITLDNVTYPNQNASTRVMDNGGDMYVGALAGNGGYRFNGYLAETVLIDGTQLAASDFGEFDSATGIWKPIDVSGLSFGTRGFYLDYSDAANLGNDADGSTVFTENYLTSADQATDTPTNNFCIMNMLNRTNGNIKNHEGATKVTTDGSSGWCSMVATMGVTKGKWYWEAQRMSTGTPNDVITGIVGSEDAYVPYSSAAQYYIGNVSTSSSIGYYQKNYPSQEGSVVNGVSLNFYSQGGDTIMFGLDMDNEKMYFGLNGTWKGTGDSIGGNTAGASTLHADFDDEFVLPAVSVFQGNNMTINFGGYAAYTISSAASDADGYGTFEYAPPSGYYALCTKNLEEYG